MTVGKTTEELKEEEFHVLGSQTARVLLQILREIRVLEIEKIEGSQFSLDITYLLHDLRESRYCMETVLHFFGLS